MVFLVALSFVVIHEQVAVVRSSTAKLAPSITGRRRFTEKPTCATTKLVLSIMDRRRFSDKWAGRNHRLTKAEKRLRNQE